MAQDVLRNSCVKDEDLPPHLRETERRRRLPIREIELYEATLHRGLAAQRDGRLLPWRVYRARGKKSEIDHLNGFIVRKGEALGVKTPVNRALLSLVKALESTHMGQ